MKEVFYEIFEKAKHGDIDAEYELGLAYAGGLVSKDNKPNYQKATKWFKLAADQGHLDSMASLGIIYARTGKYERAKNLLEKAAELGSVLAQSNLGVFYHKGEPNGINKDDAKAKKWLEKAAMQGEAEAQNNLALYYLREKNNAMAKDLFEKSALQDYAPAQANLGVLYKNDVDLKDYAKSVYWLEKAVDNGLAATASFMLGELYEAGGYGIQQDILKACLYYACAYRFIDTAMFYLTTDHTNKKITHFDLKLMARAKLDELDKQYLK